MSGVGLAYLGGTRAGQGWSVTEQAPLTVHPPGAGGMLPVPVRRSACHDVTQQTRLSRQVPKPLCLLLSRWSTLLPPGGERRETQGEGGACAATLGVAWMTESSLLQGWLRVLAATELWVHSLQLGYLA